MKNNYLGLNLKKLRNDNKLSQNKLGEVLGVSGAYIQQLEKGVKNNPSIDLIYKISKYFNVSPMNLLEWNLNDELQEFAKGSELSQLMREQAIKKDKDYNMDKYFKQLFLKPSEWEENSISKSIDILLNEVGYRINGFTEEEYKRIERSILEYLKTIVFIKDMTSK